MKNFSAKKLLTDLQTEVQATITQATVFWEMKDDLLHFQPSAGAWSIVQVLEHLNSYNRFYLPHIVSSMQQQQQPAAPAFRPGFFGNYFTNMMQPPKETATFKKYKAPKDHSPQPGLNSSAVLTEFLEGQQRLLALLQTAQERNLEKIKVPISISRFIKLKLGDTFRFLIAHQLRHMAQINRIKSQMGTLHATSQSQYPHRPAHTAGS